MANNEEIQSQNTSKVSAIPQLLDPEEHKEFLKTRINLDNTTVQIYRSLGGLEWDRTTKRWIQVRKALASPELLAKLEGLVRCYVNSNTIHGNIDENEAHALTLLFTEELIFDLAFEGESMQVEGKDFGSITRAMETLVFMTLTRAIGDGERISESNMFHTSENQNSSVKSKI